MADQKRKLALEKATVFANKFRENFKRVIKEDLAPHLKKKFMSAYDVLAAQEDSEMGGRVRGNDPAVLSKFRHLFEKQIDENIANIKYGNKGISIQIGPRSAALGYGLSRELGASDTPKSSQPGTVDFLGYYVEGMIGEFAFITNAHHDKMRSRGESLGRFGEGFLLPKQKYISERWETITGVPFSDVRHSISGQAPYKGFDNIMRDFKLGDFIDIALSRAAEALEK